MLHLEKSLYLQLKSNGTLLILQIITETFYHGTHICQDHIILTKFYKKSFQILTNESYLPYHVCITAYSMLRCDCGIIIPNIRIPNTIITLIQL